MTVTVQAWSLASTVSDVADWVSLFSGAGVVLAIWQVVRTRSTVNATKDAVNRAETRVAANHLLVVIPQLHRLEHDLDVAVEACNRNEIRRCIADWRHLASDVRGLIEVQFPDELVMGVLERSAESAGLAKSKLFETEADVRQVTEKARADIAKACESLSRLSGKIRTQSGGSN